MIKFKEKYLDIYNVICEINEVIEDLLNSYNENCQNNLQEPDSRIVVKNENELCTLNTKFKLVSGTTAYVLNTKTLYVYDAQYMCWRPIL